MKWHDADLRNDAVLAVRAAFGDRFGLYGRGWGGVEKAVPIFRAHEVYRESKIGLSVSLLNNLECYTSDRLFHIVKCPAYRSSVQRDGFREFGGLDQRRPAHNGDSHFFPMLQLGARDSFAYGVSLKGIQLGAFDIRHVHQ